jgi:hypothetical protein
LILPMRINAKEVISGVITAVIIVSSTVGYTMQRQ